MTASFLADSKVSGWHYNLLEGKRPTGSNFRYISNAHHQRLVWLDLGYKNPDVD